MTKVMTKFGMAPNLSIGQRAFPASLQGGLNMTNMPSNANQIRNPMQLTPKLPGSISSGLPGLGTMGLGSSHESFSATSFPEDSDPSVTSRTEKVLNNFLQNPVLKQEDSELNDLVCSGFRTSLPSYSLSEFLSILILRDFARFILPSFYHASFSSPFAYFYFGSAIL